LLCSQVAESAIALRQIVGARETISAKLPRHRLAGIIGGVDLFPISGLLDGSRHAVRAAKGDAADKPRVAPLAPTPVARRRVGFGGFIKSKNPPSFDQRVELGWIHTPPTSGIAKADAQSVTPSRHCLRGVQAFLRRFFER